MESSKSRDKIQSIQLFRGIAAFLVLLCHSVSNGYFPSDNILSKILINGWIGVYIFFIISGFIIPYSMYIGNYKLSSFKTFFLKRIVRIEPPYIISIVMVLLLKYSNTLTSWYEGNGYKPDWGNVLGHLGYLNAFTRAPWLNWAYWTLAIEFQYYLIIALVFPLFISKNIKVVIGSFLALLACFFIQIPGVYHDSFVPFILGIPSGDAQDTASQILLFLPFFLLGIAYFLVKIKRINNATFFTLATLCCAVSFYRYGLALTGICIASLFGIHYIKKVPKSFMWLGAISYSLYLTHYVLVSRFLAIYLRVTDKYIELGLLLSIIGCIVFAYFYYRIVEKPFIKIGHRIKYNSQKADAEQVSQTK